jgi:hypothetical protein
MNMFRDLLTAALIAIGLGIGLGHPETWTWANAAGPYVVQGLMWMTMARPWSVIVCLAIATALFMTRLKY